MAEGDEEEQRQPGRDATGGELDLRSTSLANGFSFTPGIVDHAGLKQGSVKASAVGLNLINTRREASSTATFETAPVCSPSTVLAYNLKDADTAKVQDTNGNTAKSEPSSKNGPLSDLGMLALKAEAGPFIPKQPWGQRPTLEAAMAETTHSDTPFQQDLLDRLIRVELSLFPLRDMAAQFATLRSDVDFLLRAQRQQGNSNSPSASVISPSAQLPSIDNTQSNIQNGSSDIKELSAQLADLANTVTTLVGMQHKTNAVNENNFSPQMVSSHLVQSSPASGHSQFRSPDPNVYGLPPPNSRRVSYQDQVASPNMIGSTSRLSLDVSVNSLQRKWAPLANCISADILRLVTQLPEMTPPTKIHLKAIPCLLTAREDIITQCSSALDSILTYAIPAIEMCLAANNKNQLTALICTATVERAALAHRLCVALGQSLGIRTSLAVSKNIGDDKSAIHATRPHIIIGLPQSLLDLVALRTLSIDGNLRLAVADEADTMLNNGYGEILQSLFRLLPTGQLQMNNIKQTAIVGQIISQELLDFVSTLALREPVRVLVRKSATNASSTVADDAASRIEASLRGLRHFYLYVAIASRNKTADQSWKLEAMVDLIEDLDFRQAVVYCGSVEAAEAISYKLASRGTEALTLHPELGSTARNSVMSKFRSAGTTHIGANLKKVLVVVDSLCRTMHDLHQVPIVINFDLPLAVEQYVHQASCAAASNYSRQGSVVNIITQDDIAHLRRIEGFYGIRIGELPPSHSSIT